MPESTLRCRTEGADIYSAWVNERRAGLCHSLMGNDFSALPRKEHWSRTLPHFTLLRPCRRSLFGWYESVLHVSPAWWIFLAPVWFALCCVVTQESAELEQAKPRLSDTRRLDGLDTRHTKYKMYLCLFIVGCLHHTFSFIVQMAG